MIDDGAATVEQTPVGFEEAIVGYLGDRGTGGFFLHDVTALQTAALRTGAAGDERGAA